MRHEARPAQFHAILLALRWWPMKRRNFLSGFLAAPLALKARLARLFARKPVEPCGAPIFGGRVLGDLQRRESEEEKRITMNMFSLLAAGQDEALEDGFASLSRLKLDWQPARTPTAYCSLPRGHKGPHVLLNLS